MATDEKNNFKKMTDKAFEQVNNLHKGSDMYEKVSAREAHKTDLATMQLKLIAKLMKDEVKKKCPNPADYAKYTIERWPWLFEKLPAGAAERFIDGWKNFRKEEE